MSGQGIQYRYITPDEQSQWLKFFASTLGETWAQDALDVMAKYAALDRSWVATDGEIMVGSAGAFSSELTVPGGALASVGCVTLVGVLTTHRRRGIASELMRRQLRECAERGEVFAALDASESAIYGRFGYGPGSMRNHLKIDPAHAALIDDATPSGRMLLVDAETAGVALPPVFDQVRRGRIGEIARPDRIWQARLSDPPSWRDGGEMRHVLHIDDSGQTAGFASYRIEPRWSDGLANNKLNIVEIQTSSNASYRALWQYLLSVDLVGEVTYATAGDGEPLRLMLRDPRRLRTTTRGDNMWLRLIDVREALSRRSYPVDGRVVLEILDDYLPTNSGCWELVATNGAGVVSRTEAQPDVSLDVADLASLYLGGTRMTHLVEAGRVSGMRHETVRLMNQLFGTDTEPRTTTNF